VIGCDALQVYRGLDVATAKPSAADRRLVPHHVVDEVDPRHDFSLAEFVACAERALASIASRGRVPIVVGGTGLYLRGLLRGIVALPPRDAELRSRLRAIAERRGSARLHRWLARLDPPSAARIAPGDRQRVLRALELALGSDRTWSARLAEEGAFASGVERFASRKLGLTLDRATLFDALDARVVRFFEEGLVDEVRALLAAGVPSSANALKAIGYREVVDALGRGIDPRSVLAQVQRSTRRYAKRQLTWFRREPGVTWLDAALPRERLVESALALWNAHEDA
jgi:tRNA dimethylallyltransferase